MAITRFTRLTRTSFHGLFVGTSLACLTVSMLVACATTAPAQSIALLEPADGATVSTTFKVRFGAKSMAVSPAGDIVSNSEHNHLLINQMPVLKGESVPFDDPHQHFWCQANRGHHHPVA